MGKIFLKGLLAILPVAITLTLIIWILDAIERIFGFFLVKLVGPVHYFPGLGIIVGLLLVFIIGLVMNAWLVQKLSQWVHNVLQRIPLVKTLYSSISDLMAFFKNQSRKADSRVVLVKIGSIKLVGLVTRENFSDLGSPFVQQDEELIAVYMPMSFQLGGYTIMVPRSSVELTSLSVEKAMRFVVTAGMKTAED
ncbi:MAG: DUF502 domain-containing protein [Chlamydiae bacterium]|nr:DUF502 domain-containing protein [Chlamydiota bacterium]